MIYILPHTYHRHNRMLFTQKTIVLECNQIAMHFLGRAELLVMAGTCLVADGKYSKVSFSPLELSQVI